MTQSTYIYFLVSWILLCYYMEASIRFSQIMSYKKLFNSSDVEQASWCNGSTSDSRSEGCMFNSSDVEPG